MVELHDSDLPAGEIVDGPREDGTYLRNDGVVLQPAEKNPFYVLATVHGTYEHGYDGNLPEKNRRIWNGWACSNMDEDKRAALAKELDLDLSPLTPAETQLLKTVFHDRLGADVPVPASGSVDFSKTHFPDKVIWEKCVFVGSVNFNSTHFSHWAMFGSAHFTSTADFRTAHFMMPAEFGSVCFGGNSIFGSAYFASSAKFDLAVFENPADFQRVHFASGSSFSSTHFGNCALFNFAYFAHSAQFSSAHFGDLVEFKSANFVNFATFSSAHFASVVYFEDAAFNNKTSFQDAVFVKSVPLLSGTKFYQYTVFTTKVGQWPKASPSNAQHNKAAYRRLRQVSVELHNWEDEHFFLRQEMACDVVIKEDAFSRLVVRAFGWISSYGYSIRRPLVGLAMTGLLGWFLLYNCPPDAPKEALTKIDSFALSLANTFSIFGFGSLYLGAEFFDGLSAGMKLISGIQTACSFIFLFFLGLGLRNRFRLK